MSLKPYRTNRSRAYYQHHCKRAMQRKYKIARQKGMYGYYYTKRLYGQLNKGKIHCSCGMCTEQSRVWGYPVSQQIRLDSMKEQVNEFYLYESEK
jgi:hypothetical protein